MDTGLRTRILTAVATGTLLGVLGAAGAVAFAGEVDTAASEPTTSTCGSNPAGVELPARGMGFGLTAHAAE